jgi:hypothetical protein
MKTTFTTAQKNEIEAVLRENRNDARDHMSEIEEGSDKWWSLKIHETKLNRVLMFGSWEEKNEWAQVVRL